MVDLRQVLKGGKEMAWKTPKTDWTPDDGISAEDLRRIEQNIAQLMHPIGTIYENALDPRNPREIFGFGVWERFGEGRMLVGYNYNDPDFNSAGKTGGEKEHKLTKEEMPRYTFEGVTNIAGEHWHYVLNSDRTNSYSFHKDQTLAESTGVGGSENYNLASSSTPAHQGRSSTSGGHQHTFSASTAGGDQPHNNMPPYIVVYRWIRVA